MRKPSNPFIVTGYHSPTYFCDREKELNWLLEQLENERNSVLYSWRRMGKTSLVRHLFYKLRKDKSADGIFVDLLGTVNLEEANKRIVQAILNRFGNLEKGIGAAVKKLIGSVGATVGFDPMNGTPQISLGMTRGQPVSSTLEAAGDFLTERNKPVVICIDEFQQVVNYREPNAEATFRTWMQDFPMLRFVFCGSHRHMMVSMFSDESRPFYRSAQIHQLDPLPAPVYARFIRSQFRKGGRNIDTEHLDRIFNWTRMQTYYVQLVCNKLYGKTGNVEEAIVSEAFSEIIQQEIPLFSSYQQLFTGFQWKLLVAIAKEEKVVNPMSQQFLTAHNLGAASSVSAALQALVKKEFIIHQDQAYTLHDTLLLRWLQDL
jgi:uncharacterized protein